MMNVTNSPSTASRTCHTAARSVVASELTDEFGQFSRTSGRVNGDRQCVLSIFHLVPE